MRSAQVVHSRAGIGVDVPQIGVPVCGGVSSLPFIAGALAGALDGVSVAARGRQARRTLQSRDEGSGVLAGDGVGASGGAYAPGACVCCQKDTDLELRGQDDIR